ncbi:MAG: hypothetical protein KA144_13740 [Xanthomonadaceae bacterium]|nr:hypothetical protein [Xanthomonadaceae bacterium]
MKLKSLTLISAAVFAFGFAISASAFQPSAVGCLTCHDRCDAAFDACLAAGTSYATCSSRARLCHRGCGCPIP